MTNELKPCPTVADIQAIVPCTDAQAERMIELLVSMRGRDTRPSPAPTVSVEEALTRAVRKADEEFELVGGSSRHWVRDCFLPAIEAEGLCVSRITGAATRSETIEEAFREGWQAGMNQVDRDGDNTSTPDEAWNASDAKKSHLASVVGEARPSVDVYSRPECVFNYCPHPETCKASDSCGSPA